MQDAPNDIDIAASHPKPNDVCAVWKPSQTVLVLQGGGALGAYQAGVFEALSEAGVEPDWVIGTSIGAINASLIAGNSPANRVSALREFWNRMASRSAARSGYLWPQFDQSLHVLQTIMSGIDGFFAPNFPAFLGPHVPLGSERAGYYSTEPLRDTLLELVDFQAVARGKMRLTVGAAEVRTSRMHYFDSRHTTLAVAHILASGALPPAFPPVRIDGELYWDGGILSNTPTEIVFDDYPRHDSLIFAVHMWNAAGPEPQTMWDVQHRLKDIQYSSRVASHIMRQQESHRLRHVIEELINYLPESIRETNAVKSLTDYGCPTQMHVVRLLAPRLHHEDQNKDVDFTRRGVDERWQAGLHDTRRALQAAPWLRPVDRLEGVVLHEQFGDDAISDAKSR